MTKLLVSPPSKDDIENLINVGVAGFIIGLKGFSIFNSTELSIEEIKKLSCQLKEKEIEIFISINKIIHNEDIPLLKEYLLLLDTLPISGIIYDDLSIVNIKDDLNLKKSLVWNQAHLVTNYYTCDYWYNHKVDYAILSTEITIDEIITIKKNTNMKVMVSLYGYLPMFESSRALITNYFKYINKSPNGLQYKMYEQERKQYYPIYEDEKGSYILSANVFNGFNELPLLLNNDIDYVILNGLFMAGETFLEVSKSFIKGFSKSINMGAENELINNIADKQNDKGFLYKETIYRVKNNE